MTQVRNQLIAASTVLVVMAVISAHHTTSPDRDAGLAAQVDALFLRQIRPDTPRSVFNLGSGSKPFTTLAALILEQRGRLSMEDDVRKWVPELVVSTPPASDSVQNLRFVR